MAEIVKDEPCTHAWATAHAHTQLINAHMGQTVATVSMSKKDTGKEWGRDERGDVGSTAGDLCWEKQISLKLVGELDLSQSFSRPLLKPSSLILPHSPSHPPTIRSQLCET